MKGVGRDPIFLSNSPKDRREICSVSYLKKYYYSWDLGELAITRRIIQNQQNIDS